MKNQTTAPWGAAPKGAQDEGVPNPFLESVTDEEQTEFETDLPAVCTFKVIEGGKAAPLNDAVFYGVATPAYLAALDRDVEIMTGYFFKQGDRRNTQDGEWSSIKVKLRHLIEGFDATDDQPELGFSRHPVKKQKAGPGMVLGTSVEGARKALAMNTMYFLGLDIDCGARLDDVLDKIQDLGLACFVHTSFNHGRHGMEIKRDDVLKKLGILTSPTLAQIKEYLRTNSKARYEESFIEGVTIIDPEKKTSGGTMIVLDTPPLDKMRLIFPLSGPVKIASLANTDQAALEVWESKITGMAREVLGIHFDTACTDPSRLFFTARHPANAADWHCAIVRGDPLDFDSIPTMKKSDYLKTRTAGDANKRFYTASGADLNTWYNKNAENLQIAEFLETYCPDKMRGDTKDGGKTFECPFESNHTAQGGRGTFALDAMEAKLGRGTIKCQHDSCQGRKNAEFLAEMLDAGWFTEEDLFDADAGHILECEESDEEDEDRGQDLNHDGDTPEGAPAGPPSIETLIDRIDFNGEGVEQAIRKLYKRLHKREIDKVEQARVNKLLKEKSGLDLNTLKSFWRDLDMAKHNQAQEKASLSAPVVDEADFDVMVQHGRDRITDVNKERPFLFDMGGNFAIVRRDDNGLAQPVLLRKEQFAHQLNNVATFQKKVTDKRFRKVGAPPEITSHLFAGDTDDWLPRLRGVRSCPFFAKDGRLVDTAGYDEETETYLDPPAGLVWGAVRPEPTPEDVAEAKRLIGSEVLGDFPLGRMERKDIEGLLDGTGTHEGAASLAAAFALILLPFMRDMIDGPTPAHVITKPTPGSGSGYIKDIASLIFCGHKAASMTYTTDREELRKKLTSALVMDQTFVVFDNIPAAMDSDTLASAITDRYSDRLLNGNRMIDIEPKCVWILTANNIRMSSELIRRAIVMTIDAQMADPSLRTEFRHKDIMAYVREERGRLVWACLTLIQHWIGQDRPRWTGRGMANFRNWAECVGGVLNAAGIGGFLDNLNDFREYAETGKDADVQVLFNRIAQDYKEGHLFRPGGDSEIRGQSGKSVVNLMDVLNDAMDGKPLLLDGWGYSKEDRQYNTARGIAGAFAECARRPWLCEVTETKGGEKRHFNVEIAFETGKDRTGKWFRLSKWKKGSQIEDD